MQEGQNITQFYYEKIQPGITKVLSIQSSAISSNVGIKAASTIFELLKIDCSGIPVVLYSTHTAYETYYGVVSPEGTVKGHYDAFCINQINHFHYVSTGYLFMSAFLKETAKVIIRMKARDPKLKFICDPVMGDNGRFYVDESLVTSYIKKLIPLADVVTPNLFELENLTRRFVTNLKTAFEAMDSMHELGPRIVVLTSIPTCGDTKLSSLLSYKIDETTSRYVIEYPQIDAHFCGSGDTFSALFLSWLDILHGDVVKAFETSINAVQLILQTTYSFAEKNGFRHQTLNLRLIQSSKDIASPEITLRVQEYIPYS